MTFLQPFVLWALPLILLPVIIHLLNRLRHRSQPWAAMRFLVAATRSSVNRAKLRQFLILALRTLAVLALILFLSRPLTGGWLGWAIAGAPDTIVLVLDRSASMEARVGGSAGSKREQALRSMEEAFAPFKGRSHLVVIDSATKVPTEVSGELADLPTSRPTDTAADIPGLIQTAANWLVETRAGTSEIWIASDLQASNWNSEDSRWKNAIAQLAALPQRVRVRVLTLNGRAGDNLSVSMREVFQRKRGTETDLRMVFDLAREGANAPAQQVPATISMGGTRSQLELQVEGASVRRRHSIPLSAQSEGWGSIEIPADSNPSDNKAFFVFAPNAQANSIVVSEQTAQAKFLRLAATPVQMVGKAAALTPRDFENAALEAVALVVWAAPLPQGDSAARMEEFVREGGVCAFFPPAEPASTTFLGFSWGSVETGEYNITKWNQDEGPFANTDEGFPLPLAQTEFTKRQQLVGNGSTLAAFDDGARFAVRQTLGRGAVHFFTSSADREWSSLWEGPSLVPALQRLVESGTARLRTARMMSAGETVGLDLGKTWTSVDASESKDIRTHAGIYRSGSELVAMNRPEAEDDLDQISSAAATSLFTPLSVQTLGQAQARNDRLQSEIWRLFLVAMLIFMLVEGYLILPERRSAERAANSSAPNAQPAGGVA